MINLAHFNSHVDENMVPPDPPTHLVASNPRIVSQIPHSCVVLHDSRFAIIVDGTVVDAASAFLDDGSRHSLTVLGREFVLDCRATLPPTSTLNENDTSALQSSNMAAGSLSSKASLFKMQADASLVSDASASSLMTLHPIPRGNIVHDEVPSAIASPLAPLQQSHAKREHYALYGTIKVEQQGFIIFQKSRDFFYFLSPSL